MAAVALDLPATYTLHAEEFLVLPVEDPDPGRAAGRAIFVRAREHAATGRWGSVRWDELLGAFERWESSYSEVKPPDGSVDLDIRVVNALDWRAQRCTPTRASADLEDWTLVHTPGFEMVHMRSSGQLVMTALPAARRFLDVREALQPLPATQEASSWAQQWNWTEDSSADDPARRGFVGRLQRQSGVSTLSVGVDATQNTPHASLIRMPGDWLQIMGLYRFSALKPDDGQFALEESIVLWFDQGTLSRIGRYRFRDWKHELGDGDLKLKVPGSTVLVDFRKSEPRYFGMDKLDEWPEGLGKRIAITE